MLRAVHVVTAMALCLVLMACSPPTTETAHTDEPSAGAIRMAVVGDSITDADSPDLAGGVPGPESWVSYAVGEDIELAGGWARWGATTAEMVAAVREPFDADVLVILAGTNDAGWTSCEDTGSHLVQLARNAGVNVVVLSSVPPLDAAPQSAVDLNTCLEALAEQHAWTWVDAASGLRENGTFIEGMSTDGVHPSEAGARIIGEAIAAAVLGAAPR
ncbi:SGNH/GDSL hydrolase family protein [Pseudactinotalea sp.]|uniref:SGNH/GDSL hydrolase family protein n=1 Tax=Pseudactinotalea sp. TaxID=1926260 RepID=UPI003B3B5C23